MAELDPGIRRAVAILRHHGVETCQSCEGGPGHAYPEPTVDLVGSTTGAGWHALSVCLDYGLPVVSLARVWRVADGAVTECVWRLTFARKLEPCAVTDFERGVEDGWQWRPPPACLEERP